MTEAATQNPYQRFGWLLWGTWLIFLVFPYMESLQEESAVRMVGGLVGTTAFGVVYVLGFLAWNDVGPLAGVSEHVTLGLLVAITLLTALSLGLEVLSFMPYLQSYGMFALRRPVNWWWTALIVVLTLTLPLAIRGDGDFLMLTFIVLAVSLATASGRVMSDHGEEHARVTEELTVTAERDRVARDVHDVLGHSLTVVTVKAELAEKLVDRDPARAKAELAEIQVLTRQALAEVRATVGGLRAAVLDDELVAAEVALRAAGIEADLPDDVRALDPRRRAVAAWVLREGVTNVVRHSGAAHCTVAFHESRLTITDDGRGIDPDTSGNGLRGLRERVAGSGGQVHISRRDVGGTELEVSW